MLSCPVKLNTYSTLDNDHIICILCEEMKDYFKVDGLFQISTFFHDIEFNPAILQLSNFTLNFTLTLMLPKVYQNTTEAQFHLDGTSKVEISRLKFSPLPNANERTMSSLMSEPVSLLSPGLFGGYSEAKIGCSIGKTIKRVNEKMQKSLGKIVNLLTLYRQARISTIMFLKLINKKRFPLEVTYFYCIVSIFE